MGQARTNRPRLGRRAPPFRPSRLEATIHDRPNQIRGSDLFGEAFDVVYPQLKPRRRPRVSEQASVRATRIHRSLPDDERLKLREVAQRMHVSEGTAKRYLAEYRKRHPGPERI